MRISMTDSFKRVPAPALQGKPRMIANNTFEYATPTHRVTRLHVTDIVKFDKKGRVTLNSGGWRTKTTKARMNDTLSSTDFRVYSGRGQWFVQDVVSNRSAPFFDGITLPDAFEGKAAERAEKRGKAEVKLKEDIKKFVEKTLPKGEAIPMPGNGDCWACLMFDQEQPRGKVNGLGWTASPPPESKLTRDNDHLLQHVKEGYMHGSLIVNAFRDAGYKDEGLALICGWGSSAGKPRNVSDYARIRRIVRRYLQKRLGLAF